jgi:DNA processing protein
VLSAGDPEWPAGLSVLGPYEPLLLWTRGTLPPAPQRCVSVVGSRACSAYGRRAAGRIAEVLAGAGLTVVSGGARGIDAAAHTAAMGGGRTAVVAAGGAGLVYPGEHARLFERAGHEGAVIWEYPPGARLTRSGFLHRNRLIAAVSCATVVVEAAHRSGALNTGRTAADLGRLVLGVPGPLGSPASVGVHRGIADGWAALLIDYDDLLELLAAGVG